MKPNEHKIGKEGFEKPSASESSLQPYLILSAKTLFYLFIFLSVLAAFVSQRFPYSTMRFYYDIQSFDKAVVYAEKYADTKGKHYAQCLHYGIEISDILLTDSASARERVKNAKRLSRFTKEFFLSDFFYDRCKVMDDYFFKNSSSLVVKIGLFSYKDYVFSKNTAARTILEAASTLLYDGDFPTAQKGEIRKSELVNLFRKIIGDDYQPALHELATLFNQLSQNILYGGSLIYDKDLEAASQIFDYLKYCINDQDFGGYSYIKQVLQLPDSIQKLYLLSSVANLAENLKSFFSSKDLIAEVNEVDKYFSVKQGDQQVPIYQYYLSIILSQAKT